MVVVVTVACDEDRTTWLTIVTTTTADCVAIVAIIC
jgi:hypothetical protein